MINGCDVCPYATLRLRWQRINGPWRNYIVGYSILKRMSSTNTFFYFNKWCICFFSHHHKGMQQRRPAIKSFKIDFYIAVEISTQGLGSSQLFLVSQKHFVGIQRKPQTVRKSGSGRAYVLTFFSFFFNQILQILHLSHKNTKQMS